MEKRNRIKKIMDENSEIFRLLLMMIFVFILVLIIIPDKSKFLSMSMFRSMMTQMPEIGILATAVTFAMLLGGIDLSVVGIGNLCGIIASMLVLQFRQYRRNRSCSSGLWNRNDDRRCMRRI